MENERTEKGIMETEKKENGGISPMLRLMTGMTASVLFMSLCFVLLHWPGAKTVALVGSAAAVIVSLCWCKPIMKLGGNTASGNLLFLFALASGVLFAGIVLMIKHIPGCNLIFMTAAVTLSVLSMLLGVDYKRRQ
jgi:hypothetical protein